MGMIQTAGLQKEYDVIVVGSGAGGGQAAYTLTHGRRSSADARGRAQLRPGDRDADVPHAGPRRRCAASARRTSRSASTTPPSTAAGRCRASPTSSASERPGAQLRLVARAHARRAHQSLGPHLAAQRAVRLQAAQPRRPRLRLADRATRTSRRTTTRSRCSSACTAPTTAWRTRRTRRRAAAAAAEAARRRAAIAAAREDARHSGRRRSSRRAHAALDHERSAGEAASGQRDGAEDPRRRTCSSRAACFWATPCGRGCSIRANYQSTTVHLPPALATGNLDIITDAHGARGRRSTRTARPTASSSSTRRPARSIA